MVSKCKHNTNGFETGYWCIGFTKINAFDLGVTLCNQSSLVSYHNTILILLIAKNPFGANNVVLRGIRSFNKRPNFVSLELMKLFHHSHHPIRILHCFIELGGFYHGNKRKTSTEVSQTSTRASSGTTWLTNVFE